ncbi:MAG: hemerythrin family protein [Treponema sp.]|jgi:hemerythrin|nr:hemerythrin family protein [Treponema sp.]
MIERIEWDDSYLLDVQEIDLQHKKLILIANELYDVAVGDDSSYKVLMPKIIKKLSDYTVYHFSAEEAFMKRYGYADWNIHKIAHDNFVNEITSQIKKLITGSKDDVLNFYKYIVNWILTHIAKTDKIWASFVKGK